MSNKTSDKNVANIEDGIKFLKSKEAEQLYFRGNPKLKNIFDNILAELEQKDKRIQELEEYITIAPDLDEMTAIKYVSIQQDAYIKGRADEQQKAEQIIQENYIPKQAAIDRIEELKKLKTALPVEHLKEAQIKVLQELLEGENRKK